MDRSSAAPHWPAETATYQTGQQRERHRSIEGREMDRASVLSRSESRGLSFSTNNSTRSEDGRKNHTIETPPKHRDPQTKRFRATTREFRLSQTRQSSPPANSMVDGGNTNTQEPHGVSKADHRAIPQDPAIPPPARATSVEMPLANSVVQIEQGGLFALHVHGKNVYESLDNTRC